MPQINPKAYMNAAQVLPSVWPSFLPTLPTESFLDDVWVAPLELDQTAGNLITRSSLLINGNLELGIPGVDAVKLMISAVGGSTYLPMEVQVLPNFAFRMKNLPLALRFSKDLLKSARRAASSGAGQPVTWEIDTSREYVDIQLAEIDLEINSDGDISIDAEGQIDLPPVMLGDSGVVIEAHDIGLYLDSNNPPPGQPNGYKGIHIGSASLYLPGELGEIVGNLHISNAYIGNGGFSGSVSTTWTPALSAQLFGMTFSLKSVEISFVQNALTASSIKGAITLPFFDAPVDVEIAINLNGGFAVKLGSANGLFTLSKPGLLNFEVESLGFELKDKVFTAMMSGKLQPLLGGLDWPGFEVRELSIDSEGHVHIDGGWINLREQYTLSFYGFTFEITQLGLGNNDDGTRWVGFSGGLKLIDGFKAGASVKGLRITWGDSVSPSISLEGVGVEFEVPDVLRFKGEVSYRKLTVGGNTVHRFDGMLKLELICINLEVDAQLVIGSATGPDGNYTFMGIYLGIELPAGIPLWSTGLALYGMAGLFAFNMAPDRLPEEPWYGIGPGEGWYKRPEIGVTDLSTKWKNQKQAIALGAGITIGTLPDNGFTFNGRMLFLLTFPGPILMIEGKANILKERSSLGEDPIFRCLVVLDFQAGSFLVGIDANFKFGDGGELIDIGASAEMYFSFSDPSAWHLYLGMREPRERRIRAHILSLYEANAYFMLDNSSLAMGALIGYDANWRFGPVKVIFEAWLETNVKVSWAPLHFNGELRAHGKLEISVFGFGFGFSIDALLGADVFDPFHILAKLTVTISLPWPLPDFDVEVTLEWGPELDWPLPPLPLKEIAVEHFKVTTSWPLARNQNLLAPVYATADGLRIDWTTMPGFNVNAAPPAHAPVVPLDCRPHVTFSRNVHDKARVGTMVSVVNPDRERIGDPEKNEGPILIKYSLTEIALDVWRNSAWHSMARRASSDLPANAAGVADLFGSWAPTPPMPDGGGQNQGQTKLWLWSKNPFDYVRHGGREWQDWISQHFQNMPCVQIPKQTTHCWTFDALQYGPITTAEIPNTHIHTWKHPDTDGPLLAWLKPVAPVIQNLHLPNQQQVKGFCLSGFAEFTKSFSGKNFLLITFQDNPNYGVRIYCMDPDKVSGYAVDQNNQLHTATGGSPSDPVIEFIAKNVQQVYLTWRSRMCIWRICMVEGVSQEQINEATEIATHNIAELERWKNISPILEPNTHYRLLVRTIIEAQGVSPLSGNKSAEQFEYGFFKTEGAPGLADLSLPNGVPDVDSISLKDKDGNFIHLDNTPASPTDRTLASQLNDLSLYVSQTLPFTVPGKGENRPLPRPIYRGYDLGVMFNEDYVSQMYRMNGRDLSLYVFDSNNRPVRDAEGRLLVVRSTWDVATDLVLDEVEKTWVTTIEKSSCGDMDKTAIPHNQTMNLSGLVLEPDFVHEARLTPLLLHETFTDKRFYTVGDHAGNGGTLGYWTVEDTGTQSTPSNWVIAEVGAPPMRVVKQTSNIYSFPLDGSVPAKAGTVLLLANRNGLANNHPDQPGNWTDYRVSVQMRSLDDDAMGLVFRRSSMNRWYRFSMDRERGYRRLVRMLDGVTTILAEDDFTYRTDQDYLIMVEVIGADISVYQDGELILRSNDASIDHGTIGLYCWASAGVQFADVMVDDYRATARSVYRFQFTTSRFVHFLHQIHSYQDELWYATIPAAALALASNNSVATNTALTDDEDRAWTAFSNHDAVKPVLSQPEKQMTITGLNIDNDVCGLLVRCPEPVDWKRVSMALTYSEEKISPPVIPDNVKIVGLTRHTTDANKESVAVLLREALNLNGYIIEQSRLPGPMQAAKKEEFLFEDDFTGRGGLLFEEKFGSNALDLYEILNQVGGQTSNWSINAGRIVQTSNIYAVPFSADSLPKPGTMAIIGSPDWSDVKVRVKVSSGDDDSIGFAFRYFDASNFYRFEMNRQFGYRRLVKSVDGLFTQLWEDHFVYEMNRTYTMEVCAFGKLIYGFIDEMLLFCVEDDRIKRGRVGLYCWANDDSHFEALDVQTVEKDPLLWKPDFSTLAEFSVFSAGGAIQGPADWEIETGGVVQQSNIYDPADLLTQAGTYLMGGGIWDDHIICVRLRSDDNDNIGVMFRTVDNYNYYRFAMDRQRNRRRLIKMVDGNPAILWQTNGGYNIGQSYDVVIRALGSQIQIILDGAVLASIVDSDIRAGKVALYCWAVQGAHFSHLAVLDGTRRVQRWQIIDSGLNEGPSNWRVVNGKLKQRSNVWGGSLVANSSNKPGTIAIAGNADWKNYRLSVLLRSDDIDAVGVVVRYRDADNYYLFSVDSRRNYRRLINVENGSMSIIWSAAGGYTAGDDVTLTVDVIGNRITGYMEDKQLFSVVDSTHLQGKIGLYCWANNRVDFERVVVSVSPLDAYAIFLDDFKGPALSGWTIVDKGGVSSPSNWTLHEGALVQSSNIYSLPTSAGAIEKEGTYAHAGDVSWVDVILQLDLQSDDNDAIGVMFRYVDDNNYYRFSMDQGRSYRRLVCKQAGVFRLLWQDDVQYESGRKYRLIIIAESGRLSGYLNDILVFDVRDYTHAAGKIAVYCWAEQGARFSHVRVFPVTLRYQTYLMEDDFPVMRTFRWQFIDEGDQNGPSVWEVVNGKLAQKGNISHSDASAFGTLAIDKQHDWADFRYTAVLRSTDMGHIGLVFRYQDNTHYYRVSMTSGGNKELVRRNGNQVQQLWSLPGGLESNRDYAITVDCIGAKISIYINGVRVASVLDTDGYLQGTVGLYCSNNIGAEFESVTVASPQWEQYYRFGQERLLAAGTRLRIRSGSESEAFTANPLERNRFVTTPYAIGEIRFTDSSVHLRIVSPQGNPEHTIRFLPESEFSNANCHVLRRGDGTAFVILPQGNALFAEGTYNLELIYRRDNSIAGAGEPIFSESGVNHDEVVNLIIAITNENLDFG